jgi:hypothetical protein
MIFSFEKKQTNKEEQKEDDDMMHVARCNEFNCLIMSSKMFLYRDVRSSRNVQCEWFDVFDSLNSCRICIVRRKTCSYQLSDRNCLSDRRMLSISMLK